VKWTYSSTRFEHRHWTLVISFTLRPLYPRGKSPLYPLDTRLRGPQSRSGRSSL